MNCFGVMNIAFAETIVLSLCISSKKYKSLVSRVLAKLMPDYRPRMDWFKRAVRKVRQVNRQRRRGYAFSQNESGQAELIRVYDTTQRKPKG